MELHFCSVCGYSIPNAEVDSGEARGEGEQLLCREHRAAPSAPPAPKPPEDEDLELLFCANCRVSVPVGDYRAGRARREYGSLLCGVCAKADPGTRAARREAVEAEMAADVEANDPVQTRRCSVCSAVVPHSHIVTGKALVAGDRVTCEACRAATVAAGAGGGFLRTFALVTVVAAVAGVVGYVVGPMVLQKDSGPDPIAPLTARLLQLENRVASAESKPADAGVAERERLAQEIVALRGAVDEDLRAELAAIRAELVGVRGELTREDARTEQRVQRLEGQVDEILKSLASRAAEPPREIVREAPPKPPVDPTTEEPTTERPPVPEVNPTVARLAKDLLESPEDGVRFPAANELGRLGDEAAIPALAHALVNDQHFLVRRACARSLNMLKAWFATPALVAALEDKEAYVAQQANFALRTITGQDFEVTQDQSLAERKRRAKKASKWWDDNRDKPPEGVSLHPADLIQ